MLRLFVGQFRMSLEHVPIPISNHADRARLFAETLLV